MVIMKSFAAVITVLIIALFLAGMVWAVEDDDYEYRAGLKATSRQHADNWNVNANLTIGAKSLDNKDWEPVESQVELGFNVDFAHKSWPFNIAIGILGSAIDKNDYFGAKVEGSTSELRVGIKKIWEPTSNMQPYINGGLAIISAKLKLSNYNDELSDDDNGSGGYISGGIFWTLARHLNLGFEIGYSGATATVVNYNAKAGGSHALFLFGYHW
jgi:hypothetical protein